MAMLFLLFEQQNGIQKRGQWFGERKKVRKFKGKILFSLEKFMKTMMAPFKNQQITRVILLMNTF